VRLKKDEGILRHPHLQKAFKFRRQPVDVLAQVFALVTRHVMGYPQHASCPQGVDLTERHLGPGQAAGLAAPEGVLQRLEYLRFDRHHQVLFIFLQGYRG
jgi:hypothetical protein